MCVCVCSISISIHRTNTLGESKPHLFATRTGAFLKFFQVPTQTTQIDLLLECLFPQRKDNHGMVKYPRFLLLHLVVTMVSTWKHGDISQHKSESDLSEC